MSFFGALIKPFKKLIKKIGKGIKKVAKKIGKAVGKLGIVGQIGMMFLMPYAVGALGSFFGASGTQSIAVCFSTFEVRECSFLANPVFHSLEVSL